MLETAVGEGFSAAFINAILLALWAVLPALLLSYIRQSLAARQVRPEFSLRKFETVELNRAVLLYEKVFHRIEEIKAQGAASKHFWHRLYRRRAGIHDRYADELEELETHARYLRASIMRLKCRPLQRLKWWVHIISSQFALGRALAAHVVGLALLIAAFHVSGQPAWADEMTTGVRDALVWYPLDEHLFYANAFAAGFAALAAPIFYLSRWARLRREYGWEFCALKEFAGADPAQIIDRPPAGEDASWPPDTDAGCGDETWSTILGVSHAATIAEVKDAYKALIKQNHPDRVHGMASAFVNLAEAQTKKLNAAYQQALMALCSHQSIRISE